MSAPAADPFSSRGSFRPSAAPAPQANPYDDVPDFLKSDRRY